MITLNLEAVKAAARKAYAEGRLSAQAPEPVCEYRSVQAGKTYACAIGCALTDAEAEALNMGDNVPLHVCEHLWSSDNIGAVEDIQRAHDYWAADDTWAGRAAPSSSRSRFLALIGLSED